MANDLVYLAAQALLADVEAIFTAAGVTLPDRRYTTVSEVVRDYECGQVVVALEFVRAGFPETNDIAVISPGTVTMVSADFRVEMHREGICIIQPDGSAPTVAQLEADSETIMTDTWVLQDGLFRGAEESTLTVMGVCDSIAFGPATPFIDAGAGGVFMDVAVMLT